MDESDWKKNTVVSRMHVSLKSSIKSIQKEERKK